MVMIGITTNLIFPVLYRQGGRMKKNKKKLKRLSKKDHQKLIKFRLEAEHRENQRKLELEKCQPAISQSTYETLKRTRQINFEIRNLDNNKIVKSHEKVSFGVSENPRGNDWDYN